MLRWDEILSLPVQSPPTLEFSAADIVWSKVVGWRDNIDRVARIPFARVDDFVRGESSNKECPTRFHVEARRRRPPEMHCKQKVDGILEYILYWCSFGPDDHRKGGVVRPSRNTYVPKKKSAGRPNTKRGCVCHFIVKRLIADPSIALIIYNQDKHIDKKGLPCHGPQDKKAVGTRAMFAPYISDDLRLRVLSLLHVGVSVETIMQRHNESVEKQGGPCNRDDLLTHRYVRRLERSIRRYNYELDEDDAVSIGMWVESHQSHVFFYEDFSDSDPFTLGIQSEWQLQQMIRFGNCSLLVSDSRFGTNKMKYPVHSLLVFDSDKKAIPVAWIIAPRFATDNAHKWIRALYSRVHSKDPTWKLGGFIVDDPSADVHTIREVFRCSVLLSFWRVRHAWHKNLVKKCPELELRSEMSKQLGQTVYNICKGHGELELFENFMEDFVDCSDFLDYFKAIWYPRIGMWTAALKSMPLASQETCAAMECYHHQLKLRLLNEKDPNVYQRTDWLVNKLDTKVHSYFWLDEYSGKEDFARYRKDEWMSGLTSWRRALEIPDSDVVLEGGRAKVSSQHVREKAHVVQNPGSEFAICDCSWSDMGNLCKHVIKASRLCRSKGSTSPSISLYKYYQTLMNMLHCPPQDSLIRDHAVSRAVCVQLQLNALIGQVSSETATSSVEKQDTSRDSTMRNKDVVIEDQCPSENILSSTATVTRCRGEAQGNVASSSNGDKVIDQLVSGHGICGEIAGEDGLIGCSAMDVDPSICTSKFALVHSDPVPSTCGISKNGNTGLTNGSTGMSKRDEAPDTITVENCQDKICEGACGDVLEGSIAGSMMDVDPQSDLIPPSILGAANSQSVHIEVETVDVIDSTDDIIENERDVQSGSEDMNICSSGNAFTAEDGVQGGVANDSPPNKLINQLVNENNVCVKRTDSMEIHQGSLETSTSSSSDAGQMIVDTLVTTSTVVQTNFPKDRNPMQLMDINSESSHIFSSGSEVHQETTGGGSLVSTNNLSDTGEKTVTDGSSLVIKLSSMVRPCLDKCGVQDGMLDESFHEGASNQLPSENGVCCDI